ncbi:MAG: hypothetical protein AAFQ96_03030 [Pseudomonadota bacterium]
MNVKMKSITILLATLMVGLVAGSAVTGVLLRERLNHLRSFSHADGFVERFGEMIEPLTDEQKEQIKPLLEGAGLKIQRKFEGTSVEIYAIVDQLESDLSDYLTEEQLNKLREKRAKFRNRYGDRYNFVQKSKQPQREE